MMKWLFSLGLWIFCFSSFADNQLIRTIKSVKPSIVGIGIHTPTARPQSVLQGSGFVVADGKHVVTNHHVVPEELNHELLQKIAVFVGSGRTAQVRTAEVIASSKEHDLAILKIEGKPLPAMTLAKDALVDEGQSIAFTGFPIGAVLGLYPATHRGIVAAVTPRITPIENGVKLTPKMLKSLRDPFMVYQLDATAYPGNSGSALYNSETGEVVGIINSVFIQGDKEAAITKPSGITYAIPVKYLWQLLKNNNIKG